MYVLCLKYVLFIYIPYIIEGKFIMIISNKNFIKIAVTGITGRMGKTVAKCIIKNQRKNFDKITILGAAITRTKSSNVGMDVGKFLKSDDQGIIISDNIELVKNNFDVLIDFTCPDSTVEFVKFCVKNQKNMVIGTTGLKKIHLDLIKTASKKIGIVYSTNFSIGITMMFKLLSEISKIMGNISDIDIFELHHNQKIDIPSGTAITIRNIIKSNIQKISKSFGIVKNNNHLSILYPFLSKIFHHDNIKIHSIRSGDIIGEHSVLFASIGERLKISHQAFDRNIFANGALISAVWLDEKISGLFDFDDVLGFNM